MSLQGDYDNDGTISSNDITFLSNWLAAGGVSKANNSGYPAEIIYSVNGQSYNMTSDMINLNPQNPGSVPTSNDVTYIANWLAAGGISKANNTGYPAEVTYSINGQSYTLDYHTRLKWNELILQNATSYMYIFVEVYNIPMDQFSINDGLVVDLNSALNYNISGKSDVSFNGFLQEYTGTDNVDLISDTTNALYNIKLKTNTLYHKAMAVPIPLDQDLLKKIGIYKFEDGHSYDGDTDHNLGKTKNVTSSHTIINKDTYVVDNETKKLYRMRNGVGTDLGTIPGSGDVIFT
jgi:hypothetical protein